MNEKLAKKIRRANKKNWQQLFAEIENLDFGTRLKIAWHILTHSQKAERRSLLAQRRPVELNA